MQRNDNPKFKQENDKCWVISELSNKKVIIRTSILNSILYDYCNANILAKISRHLLEQTQLHEIKD